MRPAILEDLDAADPSWSHLIHVVSPVGDGCVVAVSLTFRGVARGGIGWGDADEGGVHAAELKALEDAAAKFSERFHAFMDGRTASDAAEPPGRFTGDPAAKGVADAVSPAQLREIRGLSSSLGLDPDQESKSLYRVTAEKLSKAAGGHFTRHLRHKLEECAGAASEGGGSVSKPETFRDKRGRAIAALPGAVVKDGARYVVTITAVGGPDLKFYVSRGDGGRVLCTCADFERHRQAPGYRCEHVFAVAHFTSTKADAATAAPITNY